jgi:XTP/dITP diphosphohydrolase
VAPPNESDAPPTLVVASANPDKVAEIAAVLGDSVVLRPRPVQVGEVVEDADTLEGNARLKAVAIAEAVGEAAVADDTGLEVAALDGAPGVYSARYAGEDAGYADNVAKLLVELERVGARGAEGRAARFRTVALVRWPDGRELAVEGEVVGSIAEAPRGDHGFGYDPVFVPDGPDGTPGDRTFAEMTADEKHAVSHRGRAFRALAAALADLDPT